MWVALISVLWLASACASAPKWTESTLSLQVDGIAMNGNEVGGSQWVGTGFWIDRNLLATNAHVATRAHQLVGVDDDGVRYHFSQVVALDRTGDVAILRADRPGDKPGVQFITRPADPKALRGREIMMVGNSGGLGLGFFDGRVTNVLGDAGLEQILHNATVVGGSSGSAIYDKDERRVMGIHHSGVAALNTRVATASWHIQKVVAEARERKGVNLRALFQLQNIGDFANIWGQREFCVGAGESFKIAFNVPLATDILVFILPQDKQAVLHTGLVRGGQDVLWRAAFQGQVFLPFSLGGSGPHEMVVVGPEGAVGKVCGVIGAGEIAWERGIQ